MISQHLRPLRGLAGIALFAATLLVLGARPARAEHEIFLEVPICEADDAIDGGDDVHLASAASNAFMVGVASNAFEPLLQSSFGELRTDFTPIIAMSVDLQVGPLTYSGELTGFGNITKASVTVEVTLRDETDDVELGSQVILDLSENGAPFTQVVQIIDSGFNPPSASFVDVPLLPGHTYRVIARMTVVSDGLGARADLAGDPNRMGCIVASPVLPDSDGDGLFDDWEQNGVDVDGDGDIDVPLNAYGADPQHKDLFYEYDHLAGFVPTRNDILNVKAAFADAPLDAGGVANPDGQPGINIWLDTGGAVDPSANEDGVGFNTCADGLDNNGDGFTDGDDSDCIAGENFGGGNELTDLVTDLDATFYDNKSEHFTPERRGIFRYIIQANPLDNVDSIGGRSELGGDDIIMYNRLSGTLFHEIGHSLNLSHGGASEAPDDTNCKPNYVSIMNYQHQLGLRINGAVGGQDINGDGAPDGTFLDYSPAKADTISGRANPNLATLDETNLDDGFVLDATDPTNQLAFVDPTGTLVLRRVDGPADWDNDGDTSETGQALDVDRDVFAINKLVDCTTNIGLTADPPGINPHNDWANIRLAALADGDLANAPLNPVEQDEPNEAELFALEAAFNSTDLGVTQSDAPDPVTVGDQVTYVVTAENFGPNPATRTVIYGQLPMNVDLVSISPACVVNPDDSLVCDLGLLEKGDLSQIEIQVDTDNVCAGGAPPVLASVAAIANAPLYPGVDGNPANDEWIELTDIIDNQPPEISCNAPAAIVPPDAVIAFTATAEDDCDDAPEVEITSFTCSQSKMNGKVIDKTESCQVTLDGATVAIADSGGVATVIRWVARAEDSSGNVAEVACEVLVMNPGNEP